MTDIQQKALALLNELRMERGFAPVAGLYDGSLGLGEALMRALEQHEAFRQEVSDIVEDYSDHVNGGHEWNKLMSLIIPKTIPKPKPDPLEEVLYGVWFSDPKEDAKALRAALEARGLEIREKNND